MQVCQAAGAATSRCAESKCASSEAATYTCPGSPPAVSLQHTGQQPAEAAGCSACPSCRGSTVHCLLDGTKAHMLTLHSVLQLQACYRSLVKPLRHKFDSPCPTSLLTEVWCMKSMCVVMLGGRLSALHLLAQEPADTGSLPAEHVKESLLSWKAKNSVGLCTLFICILHVVCIFK